jgi:hypothetical protein
LAHVDGLRHKLGSNASGEEESWPTPGGPARDHDPTSRLGELDVHASPVEGASRILLSEHAAEDVTP